MELFKQGRVYDFMRLNKVIFSASMMVVMLSIWLILTKGFVFGIDFAGGTIVQVRYDRPVVIEELRNHLRQTPIGDVEIQEFGSPEEIVLRLKKSSTTMGRDIGDEVHAALAGTGSFEIRRVDMVGPKVGKELTEKGIMALALTVLGIMIYTAFRFEWRFGVAAILALVHDIIITAGMISLFEVEFDLTVLAALLTILGYSINDTIVIFDRIREKIVEAKPQASYNLAVLINEGVSETLSRSVLTVVTVFFVVLTLYLFGGQIIHGFSFAMLIGVIIGAYSSIYMASPLLIWLGYDIAKAKAKLAEKERKRIEKERQRAQYEQGVV
ncbi:MAG: protein translocase subunit SecF [Campylobacterales bacterium]